MRPAPQSFFRYPLSTLLRTEAAVRVLRELTLHGSELTTAQMARRTGITDQSVRNVLAHLDQAGVLRTYGQGRAASYQLDGTHPVARMMIEMFRAEDERTKTIQRQIQQAAERLDPRPLAVWMFGSAARGVDRPDSDLDLLLVVGDDEATERAAEAFREDLTSIEEEQHVSISVVPVSGEDVLRLAETGDPFWREILRDAVLLQGEVPEVLLSRLRSKERRSARGETLRG